MAIYGRKIIDLEDGWELVRKGILKLKSILDGHPEPQFSSEDYIMLYTTIYNMCTQKHPHDYSQQLYDRYKESLMECISSTVLPNLRENHSEFMLRELVRGGPITKLWSDGFHVFSIILIASSLLDGLYHSFMMLVSFAFVIWKMLARRLLFGKSANDDHERSILTKLKQQCGEHLTSTMEGMVIDLTLARGNHTTFEEHLRENLQADLELT